MTQLLKLRDTSTAAQATEFQSQGVTHLDAMGFKS